MAIGSKKQTIEISFFDGEKTKLKYQGTCRSCGFSTTSTLEFIQKSLDQKNDLY
jgi:Fe-S cluster biogenesis protein NfuA